MVIYKFHREQIYCMIWDIKEGKHFWNDLYPFKEKYQCLNTIFQNSTRYEFVDTLGHFNSDPIPTLSWTETTRLYPSCNMVLRRTSNPKVTHCTCIMHEQVIKPYIRSKLIEWKHNHGINWFNAFIIGKFIYNIINVKKEKLITTPLIDYIWSLYYYWLYVVRTWPQLS